MNIDPSKITTSRAFAVVLVLVIIGALPQLSSIKDKTLQYSIIGVLLLILIFAVFKGFEKSSIRKRKKTKTTPPKIETKKSTSGSTLIVFILSLLLVCGIYYQFNSNSIIFVEEFDDNKYPIEWKEGEQEEAFSEIRKGNYMLNSKSGKGISRRINIEKYTGFTLNDTSNYEIELRIKLSEKKSKDGFGLQWSGSNIEKKFFGFYLNGNQEYSIKVYHYSSSIISMIDWKKMNDISILDFNRLKIKKDHKIVEFYINDELVETIPYDLSFGNEIGFNVPPFSTVLVDYIRVLN
jgi:hypothetical protein